LDKIYFELFVVSASVNVTQVGFNSTEDSISVNPFGVGLSSDPSSKHG